MLVRTERLPQSAPHWMAGKEYEIGWDGNQLRTTPFLAFDTETVGTGDLSREVPELALLAVTNGQRTVLAAPEDVARFVLDHKGAWWSGFNVAFDWWVIHEALRNLFPGSSVQEAAISEWQSVLDEGRLHDMMLLDFLARLADPCAVVHSTRDLGQAAKDWLGTPVDKNDPYRKRFGELIGADWSKADPGFFRYAVGDVLATHAITPRIWEAAQAAAKRHGAKGRWKPWGILTEQIQVRAAVVLAEAGRRGMAVDRDQVDEARKELRLSIEGRVEELRRIDPDLFDYYKAPSKTTGAKKGDIKRNKTTGVPMLKMAPLRAQLQKAAEECEADPDCLPRTEKRGDLATKAEDWAEIAPDHPVVAAWTDMVGMAKTLQFLDKLQGQSVHPRYQPIVRTGRTSAKEPNIQNMPREPWFRSLFLARPGKRLVIVDYSFIELRTLAAVCLDRYGWSQLAKVIKAGTDPHCFTAALVGGWEYAQVLAGVKAEKAAAKAAKEAGLPAPVAPFSEARQAAKALNFGVPGGLGAKKLALYAKANYGVELDPAQAKGMRDKLVNEVYPELAHYLSDKPVDRVAAALGCDKRELLVNLDMGDTEEDEPLWMAVQKIVEGIKKRANGTDYSPAWRTRVWEGLARSCRDEDILPFLQDWKGSKGLARRLFGEVAVTITGRVRAGLGYCEARNTPFQGLAADGAKQALWELWREGYEVVAFVHDEVVVEVDEGQAEKALQDVQRIMNRAMESVWACDLPCQTEGVISERWTK